LTVVNMTDANLIANALLNQLKLLSHILGGLQAKDRCRVGRSMSNLRVRSLFFWRKIWIEYDRPRTGSFAYIVAGCHNVTF
jgi:hypothetical protein